MQFKMAHTNINVMDIERSVKFYEEAFGLHEVRRKEPSDGSYVLVFMSDDDDRYQLELTWLADRTEPYDLSDNEIHIAFATKDMEAARKKHREMGIISLDNAAMGVYFIEDPDGYWMEVVPQR